MSDAPRVSVVGAGLAGCEAADRLTRYGLCVDLYEMKPARRSPAHHADGFAELVCSNSLRSDRLENAVGLLKQELRTLDSLILRCADATRVPAGGALAVDRESFSNLVTEAIRENPRIAVHSGEVTELPSPPAIVATGPLTSEALSGRILALSGGGLHFYDAAAPVITFDSIDHSVAFRASRYERGADYLNCPLTREEYFAFHRALVSAETVPLHGFETPRVSEGCMPVEVMAKRGELTLAYGPMKPVGLTREGRRPSAVVQLRQDDAAGTLWNMVGFQTNLRFAEQRRVFGMIPGLAHAEFARYGVMHRNTFLKSPGFLDANYQVIARPGLYFAGQITGVEGYVESAASGLLAGAALARQCLGLPPAIVPAATAIGALAHYVSGYQGSDFQPMNVTFGIMEPLPSPPRGKRERYQAMAQRALAIVKELKTSLQ